MNVAELLDRAGTKLSLIDAALGLATERQAVGDHAAAQKHITAAHTMLAPAGIALMRVAMAVLGSTPGTGTGDGTAAANVTWTRPDGSTASVRPPRDGEGAYSYVEYSAPDTGIAPGAAAGVGAQFSAAATALGISPLVREHWPRFVDYLADPKRYGVTGPDPGANDDPQGTGSIDPATLTRENWAYFANHNLGSKWGKIFSGKQSDMNRALGKFHGGDLATATEEAGPLAVFVKGAVIA